MDLEQLTKHQIVLLTLLVSFVTSIATGIVTVALMDQAPPSVTRTINQIVEHTVEQVVPQAVTGPTVTTEKTVVVKDDDLVAQSIAAAQKSVIRIVAKGDDTLVARGVIMGSDGTALTDGASLVASGASSFEAILSDGSRVPVSIPKEQSTSTPVETITVAVGTSTAAAPAAVADPGKLALGQSVIRIGGAGQDTVAEGVIASLPQKGSGTIEATVSATTPGSLIMTIFGEVVGITTGDSSNSGTDFYTMLPTQAASAPPATKSSSNS